jgi:hypothetical protein
MALVTNEMEDFEKSLLYCARHPTVGSIGTDD